VKYLPLLLITVMYGQDAYLTVPSPLDSAGTIRMIQPMLRPAPMPHFTLPYYPNQNRYAEQLDLSNILIPEILKLWKEYKEECYNDSTYIDTGFWFSDGGVKWFRSTKNNDTFSWWMKHLNAEPIDIYNHRQPSLDGFMEYLERRK